MGVLYVSMEQHTVEDVIGDTTTNNNGTETCKTDDCLNNYTPYNVEHLNYCVTCASEMGIDVTK